MIQKVFERIARYGLVNWAVLLQGICGVPGLLGRLSASCIEDFASTELENVGENSPLLEIIVDLAVDGDLPLSELCKQLQKLIEFHRLDMERARRIWRALTLEELLGNLDADPVYGLINLSEFWSVWEWPIDAPLSMIPSKMTLPQHQYHSVSNYARVIQEHKEWLRDELAFLRFSEASI